jgi:hypothetical protein
VNQLVGAAAFSSYTSFAATVTIATPAVWTKTSHGMANGTPVLFTTSGALPTGFVVKTVYYTVSVATNTFQLALTVGGAAIASSGSQSGTHTCFEQPLTTWQGSVTGANPIARYIANFTVTIATPAVGTLTAHGMANGLKIVLATSGALPTGLAAGTTYYIINATANTFQLSLTPGGAAVNTTGIQSGTHTLVGQYNCTIA